MMVVGKGKRKNVKRKNVKSHTFAYYKAWFLGVRERGEGLA